MQKSSQNPLTKAYIEIEYVYYTFFISFAISNKIGTVVLTNKDCLSCEHQFSLHFY